jgi:SAM-dependent methyltransferase
MRSRKGGSEMGAQDKEDKLAFERVFEPDDYLYFYEGTSITEEGTEREIDFLIKELELDKPMKILDLACGHGRHANRLAKLGHTVVGVDVSKGFLEIAQANKKGNVKYVKEDMREISFKEVDRALLLFTSFGYFDDRENFRVLENVAAALKSGGLFCFDIPNRDAFLKNFSPFIVTEKEGNLMIDRSSFDVESGRWHDDRIYIRKGKRVDAPFSVRLYNFTEMKRLLDAAGLDIQACYGDWNAQPFTGESRRMIVVAKKV